MNAPTTVEAEVLAVLDRFREAVSTGDLEGTLALFAPDADALLVGSEGGEAHRGPRELEAFFRRLYARPVRYSWNWTRRSVSAAGQVAWLFADGEVIVRRGGEETRAPYRITGVLERRAGRWLWLQYHGSEPAAG